MSWLADTHLPFTAALGLLLILTLLQIVGVGGLFDADADVDLDADGALDTGSVGLGGVLLTLLGIGRVPFFVWLILFLLMFAGIGYGIQEMAAGLTGAALDPWLASLLALLAGLPVTATLVRPLAHVMPQDETSAVGLDSLVGRRARITHGRAARGFPARAQVRDRFGHAHHVMVEPHEDSSEMLEGDELLLVRREEQIFYGTPLSERRLAPTG